MDDLLSIEWGLVAEDCINQGGVHNLTVIRERESINLGWKKGRRRTSSDGPHLYSNPYEDGAVANISMVNDELFA